MESWQARVWERGFISMSCRKDAFNKNKAFKGTKFCDLLSSMFYTGMHLNLRLALLLSCLNSLPYNSTNKNACLLELLGG